VLLDDEHEEVPEAHGRESPIRDRIQGSP
jgi:hypothetical protein